jgi:hypothetical protein
MPLTLIFHDWQYHPPFTESSSLRDFPDNRALRQSKGCTLHKCWGKSPSHTQCWFRVMPPLQRTAFITMVA